MEAEHETRKLLAKSHNGWGPAGPRTSRLHPILLVESDHNNEMELARNRV